MKILVTGGTVFASRYTAGYFAGKGHEVYVLNRGTKPQEPNVRHICADRHSLGDTLKRYSFDAVLDVSSYNENDVRELLDALGSSARSRSAVRTRYGAHTARTSSLPKNSSASAYHRRIYCVRPTFADR